MYYLAIVTLSWVQMASMGISDVSGLRSCVRNAEICAARPGYWKLEHGPVMPSDVQGNLLMLKDQANSVVVNNTKMSCDSVENR